MKRIVKYGGLALVLGALALVFALPVSAAPPETAPDEDASHAGHCATMMGGQHIAEHAQIHNGVADCAQMSALDRVAM